MNQWIKLTPKHAPAAVYINTASIRCLISFDDHTNVFECGSEDHWEVMETPEEIIKLMYSPTPIASQIK